MAHRAHLELWSDLEAAGGVRLHSIPRVLAGELTRSLEQTDTLQFQVPSSDEWVDDLALRTVVRHVNDWGDISEWRVSSIERIRGHGEGVLSVMCDSPLVDLGSVGYIRDDSTAGQSWHNLGGVGIYPTQYLETFVIPTLVTLGTTYVVTGTVESTEAVDLAWDRWTPLQLLTELARRTNTELEFRRTSSSGYAIDMLMQRGSTANTVLMRVGRQLRSIRRTQRVDTLRTVVLPAGGVPAGGVEAASVGYNAWLVDARSSSGSTVTLKDPSSGDGPVRFNDQLTNLWLLLPETTLVQITSASTAQVVALSTGIDALSTGDHVQVCRSSAGQHLLELTNPSATASYGRIAFSFADDNYRGERNHIVNPFASAWANEPRIYAAQGTTVSQSSTTINVVGLPTTLTVHAGDVLVDYLNLGTMGIVTAQTTVDATGGATLSLSRSVFVGANQGLFLYAQSTEMPDRWDIASTSVAVGSRPPIHARDRTVTGTLTSGVSDGAQSLGSNTFPEFRVTGLAPGTRVQPGDVLTVDGVAYPVLNDAQAGTSGGLGLVVVARPAISTTDGESVTITRPTLAGSGGNNVIVAPLVQRSASTQANALAQISYETPRYTFRFEDAVPSLWASVELTYYASTAVTLQTTASPSVPQLALVDYTGASTGVLVASLEDEARTLAAGSYTRVALRLQHELTSDQTLALRFTPPHSTAGGVNPLTFVHGVQMHLGPDPFAPLVEGSHANLLWQASNRALEDASESPATYQATFRDLARVAGYNADEERLTVGGSVRWHDTVLGEDTMLRVVSLTEDLLDVDDNSVTLATFPPRLTRLVGGATRTTRVFVSVDISTAASTAGTAGGGTGVPVSTASNVQTGIVEVAPDSPNEAQPRQRGAKRAVSPSTGGSTGMLDVDPLDDPLALT